MSAACEALGIPVVSGNVSLYNDTDGRSIHPTPVVGCVGLVPDVRRVPGAWREGDAIYLAGEPELSFDGSEYQAIYGRLEGTPAPLDLTTEARLVRELHELAPRCSLVHDVSEGGLAIALAEAAIFSGIGAELDLPDDPARPLRRRRRTGGPRLERRSSRSRASVASGAIRSSLPIEDLRQAYEVTS